MARKAEAEFELELLKKKLAELKNLTFPESPEDPFLDNLYLELADYEVSILQFANKLLEGRPVTNKEIIRIDNDWNEKLETFNPDQNNRIEACSALKQYKQNLDDFVDFVLKIKAP
jgi:hypothetical protein